MNEAFKEAADYAINDRVPDPRDAILRPQVGAQSNTTQPVPAQDTAESQAKKQEAQQKTDALRPLA